VLTPDGRFAYVLNKQSANVSAYRIDSRTGALTRVAGSPFAAPKIVRACNEQAYFYVSPGGMPLLMQFTIRHGVVVGILEERGG